ncbi:MAG: dihydropteroate synthase [Victivallales bacterium]
MGLKNVQGKCAVIQFKQPGGRRGAQFIKKARKIEALFGAAILVMAFDENGQADTLERRLAVCKRSYRLLTEQAGFKPEDIIFDPNVLPSPQA